METEDNTGEKFQETEMDILGQPGKEEQDLSHKRMFATEHLQKNKPKLKA